jgi:glycosyltransferase involved in cell wall biosynthesis
MMSQRLTIGLLAPPWATVPPRSYGGTELVVHELARGLRAEGHDAVVVAPDDSAARWDAVGHGDVELAHVMNGYDDLAGCDVIHDHTLLGPAWALARGLGRVVTTCHGPLRGELAAVYRRYAKQLPVVAISHDQAGRAPDVAVDRVIHHGVEPDDYPVGREDGGYLLFLGRMTPDKGIGQAIAVARAAGRRLVISAKTREADEQAYFTDEIEPLLGDDVVFVGESAHDEKVRLMGGALALLNPIQWPEPFGLVMIEALACGTPVIACPHGAAPEIVEDGVTGFLSAEHDGLVAAVRAVADLDRTACRDAVKGKFSARRMVAEYLDLYRDTMARAG